MLLVLFDLGDSFQVKWCSQVTSDPCDTVGSMLAETFMGLEPPLHQCIAKCVERDSLQLTPLITLRQVGLVSVGVWFDMRLLCY